MRIKKSRIRRSDALYRGLPRENARKIQRKLKRQGLKTHATQNDFGTYDIYRSD